MYSLLKCSFPDVDVSKSSAEMATPSDVKCKIICLEFLFDKIEILFKNKNLRHFMGLKSREKALSMSWENMSTNMEKMYRDVVAKKLVGTNI